MVLVDVALFWRVVDIALSSNLFPRGSLQTLAYASLPQMSTNANARMELRRVVAHVLSMANPHVRNVIRDIT